MLPENSEYPKPQPDTQSPKIESQPDQPSSGNIESMPVSMQGDVVTQSEYPEYDDAYPFVQKRRIGGWTDDDIAGISLSGCLSVVILTVIWTAIYIGNAISPDVTETSGRTLGETDNMFLIGTLVISFVGFMGSAYFFGIRNHPKKWQSVGFKAVSVKWILASIAIGVLFMPLNIGITVALNEVLDLSVLVAEPNADSDSLSIEEQIIEESTPTELILLFVLAAILIPIAEEVFFRGILYRWLRVRAGLWLGLGISAVVFGSLHLGPQVLSISILGAIMAVVYERSKSLWTAITIHATNNALALILTFSGLLTDLNV